MQKITPFLWFEKDAAAIIAYYKNIFGENLVVHDEAKLNDTPSGDVQVVRMRLFETEFRFMTAGPHDTFNDAVSFEISCKDQAEIDKYWDALTREGKEQQCGWCIDKYGVRWQIVPEHMSTLVSTKEGVEKMLKMTKIIIADF